jgi:hypothetical protein
VRPARDRAADGTRTPRSLELVGEDVEYPAGTMRSRQIVPKRLLALMTDPDAAKAQRAMQAMLAMKRIDIAAVERAAEGEPASRRASSDR